MSSQIEQIKILTKMGRGLVFFGPELFLPSLSYSQTSVFEEIRESLSDSTGWESCDEDTQLSLAITELGAPAVVEKLTHSFPYLEVQSDGGELAKSLNRYRPKYIVDLNFHNALDSFLIQQHHIVKRVVHDQDLSMSFTGKPTAMCYKLRGDLWLEQSCLTIDQLNEKLEKNPKTLKNIRTLCREEPVFLVGFNPQSRLFRWVMEQFLDEDSLVLSCFVSSNRNWKKWCQNLGHSTLCAPTRTELTQKLSLFFEDNTRVDHEAITQLKSVVARDSIKRMKSIDQLQWLESARSGNRQEIKDARESIIPICHDWMGLYHSNLLVDPAPLCRAIAFQTRSGFSKDADVLMDTTIEMINSWSSDREASLASIGRSLMRNGDDWRGYIALRQALLSGHLEVKDQADSLAWVSKAVLARIEELMIRGHVRAATEQIAQFLNTFATLLSISADDATDEESKWSLYYINLRLGRIMMLASGMAGQSNLVYAQQSVTLLLRTIEFVPEKPDGYKYLRPMLTDSASPTFDLSKWESLMDQAPPAIQKKLTDS
jgi:hypothetical protein